jgi:DNA-binding response OmpR family regulator
MLRLLIVEDDVLVGLCLKEELLDHGCSVALEHDAESVLSKSTDRTLDAAILDITLPGVQGDDLARRLRRSLPSLPIVLSTGLALHEIAPDLLHDPRICVLQKPYPPAALVDNLRKLEVNIGPSIVATAGRYVTSAPSTGKALPQLS